MMLYSFRMPISSITFIASRVLRRESVTILRTVTHQMFHRYLLVTNVTVSGILSCCGDLMQQRYEMIQDDRRWDRSRTMRMTASGIAIGFVCHYWYLFLDKRFPGNNIRTVMKKVVIDQLICSPMYITVFFATTCYMEGKNFIQFKDEMIQKAWRLFLADCIVWPPAQILNFYFLPPRFRVLYDNLISLGCDIYTSYVKNEIPMEEKYDKFKGDNDK